MHVAYRQRRSTATRNTLTAWLLVAGLLASPLLTYLATPLAQRHADGVWTVLCTLKGNEPVFIALAEGPGTGEADSADCPALQMLQMFGHATLPLQCPVRTGSPICWRWPSRRAVQAIFPNTSPPFRPAARRSPERSVGPIPRLYLTARCCA